jgi:hypothetical protein
MKFRCLSICLLSQALAVSAYAGIPAFPGAEGFGAAVTTGGRGGQVIYVTNRKCEGPGSLYAALATPGKKYVLFKVSGIIDCAAEILWGDVTIAGQTAPGGIIVRGVLADDWYDKAGKAQNIIIRHVNSRPHTEAERAGKGWIMDDALRLDGAKKVVVDHSSFANATDESVQISRSSDITLQNNMLAETLGDHYYLGGMLFNYSVAGSFHRQDRISIHHTLWNRIGGRVPEISCEQSADVPDDRDCLEKPFKLELANNVIWDIPIQVWYNPGFYPDNSGAPGYQVYANIIKNYAVGRNAYTGPMFNHNLLEFGYNRFYVQGNRLNLYPDYKDYQLFYCCNDFNLYAPNTDFGVAQRLTARHAYPPITYTPTGQLVDYMAASAGAFNGLSPGRRDPMNRRLLRALADKKIDTHPVNGTDYFHDAFKLDFTTAPAAPPDTDKDGMPNVWEKAHGLNPAVPDHNGTELSIPMTGIAGYTNLECYLNELADKLVAGP